MEGIMMKNQDKYAVAVRKPDQTIEVKVEDFLGIIKNKKLSSIPFIRGVFNFIDSLVLGMKTLTYSASFYEEEEEESKVDQFLDRLFKGKAEKVIIGITVALSIVMAVGLFMLLPYFVSQLFQKIFISNVLIAVIEGILRILLFLGYLMLISKMKDIQRVFMYHGAEHKCINCIEHGLELNIANVKASSRQHKRCGTSFMLIVMVVSVIFFIFIRFDTPILRLLSRIVLVPLIAGVSYEFIRLAGRTDNAVVGLLSKPGLWLQNLTTREPDETMIEVAISSVEAVFDWKTYLEQNFKEKQEGL